MGGHVLEPLEHSVLMTMWDDQRLEVTSDCEPLEHSVHNVTLDDGSVDDLPQLEPLEHSVLNMALDNGISQGISEPMFGSDHGLTFTEIPDAMRNVDLGLERPFCFRPMITGS